MVVDVVMDGFAGGLEFRVERRQDRADSIGDLGVGRALAVAFHADHFQKVFDAAHQGLQFADIGRGWCPRGRGFMVSA
jgi:hypothetical protein